MHVIPSAAESHLLDWMLHLLTLLSHRTFSEQWNRILSLCSTRTRCWKAKPCLTQTPGEKRCMHYAIIICSTNLHWVKCPQLLSRQLLPAKEVEEYLAKCKINRCFLTKYLKINQYFSGMAIKAKLSWKLRASRVQTKPPLHLSLDYAVEFEQVFSCHVPALPPHKMHTFLPQSSRKNSSLPTKIQLTSQGCLLQGNHWDLLSWHQAKVVNLTTAFF